MDLPIKTARPFAFGIVDVANQLSCAVQITEAPVDGEAHGGPTLGANEVKEERRNYRMGLFAAATQIDDWVDVRGPTRQIGGVLK